MLLPFFCDLDQDGVSAEKGDDADHDQVLERDEHVKLEPEEVVKTEDGTEAEVEPDAGRRERQVGDVDADFEPTDEHEQDGGDAEEGEGVGDDRGRADLRFAELVLDLRLHR